MAARFEMGRSERDDTADHPTALLVSPCAIHSFLGLLKSMGLSSFPLGEDR